MSDKLADDVNFLGNLMRSIDNLDSLDESTRKNVMIILKAEAMYRDMMGIGGDENEPHSSSIGREG